MGLFKKKPVVIEAYLYEKQTCRFLHEWMGIKHALPVDDACGVLPITIHTLEGDMDILPGDMLIRGVKGEFYPCKPDIFEATYEPVN